MSLFSIYKGHLLFEDTTAGNLKAQSFKTNQLDTSIGVPLFTESITSILTIDNKIYVGSSLGNVSSYDGANWKNFDGTGTGVEIFAASLNNGEPIQKIIHYNNQTLFISGIGGLKISSYDGTNWKNFDGTGTGTGLFINDTTNTILPDTSLTYQKTFKNAIVFNGLLILLGEGGNLASYDGTNWKNFNGTGAGLGPNLQNHFIIDTINIYKNNIIVIGELGKISSYDGTNWKNFDGTGTGTGIFNNTNLVSNQIISSFVSSKTKDLIIVSQTGEGASHSNNGLKTSSGQLSGTGFFSITDWSSSNPIEFSFEYNFRLFGVSNSVLYEYTNTEKTFNKYNKNIDLSFGLIEASLNGEALESSVYYNNSIVFGGRRGKISSFDLTNYEFKNADGTGLGTSVYNDGSIVERRNIIFLYVDENNHLIVLANDNQIASYDGSNWKASNGEGVGTGIFNDGLNNETVIALNLLKNTTNNVGVPNFNYVFQTREKELNDAVKLIKKINSGNVNIETEVSNLTTLSSTITGETTPDTGYVFTSFSKEYDDAIVLADEVLET